MSGLYSHQTLSTGTILTASRYNGAHQNHIDNHIPEMMDDYSVNVAEMRAMTDPGPLGSENLPTTLAGEVERIRHQIAQITGKTHWYEGPGNNVMNSGVSIDGNDNISGHGLKAASKTSSFTLAAGDRGKVLECESGLTVTVPDDVAVVLPVGYAVTIVQAGSGQVSVTPGFMVTIHSNLSLDLKAQWAAAFLYKRAPSEWVLGGGLAEP